LNLKHITASEKMDRVISVLKTVKTLDFDTPVGSGVFFILDDAQHALEKINQLILQQIAASRQSASPVASAAFAAAAPQSAAPDLAPRPVDPDPS